MVKTLTTSMTLATQHAAGQVIKHHLTSASIAVKTLEYTTTQVTSTWLLPEMVLRVANMLNYFLQFLTGRHPTHLNLPSYFC